MLPVYYSPTLDYVSTLIQHCFWISLLQRFRLIFVITINERPIGIQRKVELNAYSRNDANRNTLDNVAIRINSSLRMNSPFEYVDRLTAKD